MGDIRRQIGARDRADEVALALSIGAAAIDEGLLDVAREHLLWAKHHVPRIGAVREALGVACYLIEDYRVARTELQAYRRLTGRNDQNHVLADCERAVASGDRRTTARIAELVESMEADAEVEAQRRAEGMIVWASALADTGDLAAGRAVLRRELERRRSGEPDEATRRVWYVAGDLAERAGDVEAARELFARLVADDDAFHDATQRLDALSRPR